ncbi:MAG: TA0956 family protein [Thermoplasmata archaeon]
MTECIMYNVVLGDFHPSTICVERSRFPGSLNALLSLTNPEYAEESLKEYIEEYARTDEIMPEDKTVGFVVFNLQKRIVSVSLSSINASEDAALKKLREKLEGIGFVFELDGPSH